MNYLMKAYKVSNEVNEYILFNTEKRTKQKVLASDQDIKQFKAKQISKLHAVFRGLLDYRQV